MKKFGKWKKVLEKNCKKSTRNCVRKPSRSLPQLVSQWVITVFSHQVPLKHLLDSSFLFEFSSISTGALNSGQDNARWDRFILEADLQRANLFKVYETPSLLSTRVSDPRHLIRRNKSHNSNCFKMLSIFGLVPSNPRQYMFMNIQRWSETNVSLHDSGHYKQLIQNGE